MSSTPPSELHRASHAARIALRRQEFRQLTHIQRKLERRFKTIVFNEEQLIEVCVARGAPFDVDEDDPLDLEPRFFLPGSVEEMERGLSSWLNTPNLMSPGQKWPQPTPIENHHLRRGDERRLRVASAEALDDASSFGGFCEKAAKRHNDRPAWTTHQYMDVRKMPSFRESWQNPDDGRPCWHIFLSGDYYMWSRGPGEIGYHPDVPHAAVTVYDMTSPRSQGILRSELLVAVSLLKAQIRNLEVYLDHYVCPVLVVSFHGRFTARVVQAHFENGRVIVRPSRLVNLHTRVVSPEAKLVMRWLNSRPVGDTRIPTQEHQRNQDNSSLTTLVTPNSTLQPKISA